MKNKIKNIIVIIAVTFLLSGCVKDSFDIPVADCVSPDLIKNKEVSAIYSLATATAVEYTTDDIIEAIVTSSDEGGNFFKTLSLLSIDGTRGFSIAIDDYNMYTKKLQPGKKVYIKMKGLYFVNPSSNAKGLLIGAKPTSTQIVDRIPELEYNKFIIPSCTIVDEESIVKKLSLAQLNNDAYINALVEVDNVEFENEGATYGNKPSDAFDKNENITDGVTSFVTRTSKFASFSGNPFPVGRGKIRGVLTKFGNTYQLIIREERDVKLNGPRIDYWLPIVGNNIQYLAAFTENFESYTAGTGTAGQNNFPKYINDPVIGTKTWRCRAITGTGATKYIEMSSFGSPLQNNRALFIVPVKMTGTNKLSFKTRASFFTGNSLKVYYSTNYIPGSNVDTATLINITSNFSLSDDSNSNFNSSIPSGGSAYTLPNVGNGFIIFEYTGSGVSTPAMTTNFGIDDITVN
jgi:Family of unknown function (DUF5689)